MLLTWILSRYFCSVGSPPGRPVQGVQFAGFIMNSKFGVPAATSLPERSLFQLGCLLPAIMESGRLARRFRYVAGGKNPVGPAMSSLPAETRYQRTSAPAE